MSVTNAQRRYVRELHTRKGRRKYSAFLAEGVVNVGEALGSGAQVREVYALPRALVSIGPVDARVAVFEVGPAELARLSTQRSPHGAVAVVEQPQTPAAAIAAARRILHLDGVADPGNVGTLIRTAEWFGCGAVTAGEGTADWYNPKVVAAARGSLFRLPHRRLEDAELEGMLATHTLVSADLGGESSARFAWPEAGILAIGSESHGPSAALRRLSPKRVTLPPARSSRAESLNAAVAGGILLAAWAGS